MAIINVKEIMAKHWMQCDACNEKLAEISVPVYTPSGENRYDYCKRCAHDLALSILIDYDKLNQSPH